jgi:hypothetical protein
MLLLIVNFIETLGFSETNHARSGGTMKQDGAGHEARACALSQVAF